MLRAKSLQRVVSKEQILPLIGFAAVITGLFIISWLALAGLASDYADYAAAADTLDRLEGRKPSTEVSSHASGMRGSPFLEGATANVAGAALQERVAAAVQAAGGNVLSSQVDLQGSEARQGYVSLSASCELSEEALQQLIYDLESGMPFLFVDQLVVQAPQTHAGEGKGTAGEQMRLQIDISGQWQARK
jgi:general secretion pathway protein M